jgi:hypothetical protein
MNTMDIPIVRTPQEIDEEKVKQQQELERQRLEKQKRRDEGLEAQRAYIVSIIKEAFERDEKSIVHTGELYREIIKELESKGYRCVYKPSNTMYLCNPPRPVPGETTIYFE